MPPTQQADGRSEKARVLHQAFLATPEQLHFRFGTLAADMTIAVLAAVFAHDDCTNQHSHPSVLTMRQAFDRFAEVVLTFLCLFDCAKCAFHLETAASNGFQFERPSSSCRTSSATSSTSPAKSSLPSAAQSPRRR